MTASAVTATSTPGCPDRLPYPAQDASDAVWRRYWEVEAKRAFYFRDRAVHARPIATSEVDQARLVQLTRQMGVLEKTMFDYQRTTESYRKRLVASDALVERLQATLATYEGLKRRLWELWGGIDETAAPEAKRQLWELWSEL